MIQSHKIMNIYCMSSSLVNFHAQFSLNTARLTGLCRFTSGGTQPFMRIDWFTLIEKTLTTGLLLRAVMCN